MAGPPSASEVGPFAIIWLYHSSFHKGFHDLNYRNKLCILLTIRRQPLWRVHLDYWLLSNVFCMDNSLKF